MKVKKRGMILLTSRSLIPKAVKVSRYLWLKFCQIHIPIANLQRFGHDEYTHYYYAQAIYILGDETYDWAAVVRGMLATGGETVLASEEQLMDASRVTEASPTGAAGFAGVMELRRRGAIRAGEAVAVLLTGRER